MKVFEEHENLEHRDTEWCESQKKRRRKILSKRRSFQAVDMGNG
jgi:hypothetical protein